MLKILDMEKRSDETIYSDLIGVEGIIECNYDGHFGANIYVDMVPEKDTPKTWKEIEKVINRWIES